MAENHSTSHIIQSLVANALISLIKGVAAFFTGSGAMLAETLHSAADCGNQLLLLLGVRGANRPADATHPLGYGRSLYFWSFMVALLLFSGGGVFSIYEGLHKIQHPEALEKVWLGLGILGISLLIEGAATLSNLAEIRRRRGPQPLMQYLRNTKDSDLVVVFGENAAASAGLVLAMGALGVAWFTGDARWDGLGSLLIGLVLVGVAIFLAIEVKSLLVGESADAGIEASVRELVAQRPAFVNLIRLITVQQGPGEVMLAAKVHMQPNLSCTQVVEAINELEDALQAKRPEVRWSFIEPDVQD